MMRSFFLKRLGWNHSALTLPCMVGKWHWRLKSLICSRVMAITDCNRCATAWISEFATPSQPIMCIQSRR